MSKKQKTKAESIIIIGAGPAGMTAAILCARAGKSVLLLEKNAQLGKKILSTGNGKCNLTNLSQKKADYRSEHPDFAWDAYQKFSAHQTLEFFESLGVYTREKNGYVYPYNEQATTVREALEEAIIANPLIKVQTECTINALSYSNKKESYQVITDGGVYSSDTILLSVGGSAAPKLGSVGNGYSFAKVFGHHIIKPLPSLCALKSSAPFLKKLAGVRNQAKITLLIDGEKAAKEQGELQWTDYGISGVAIFQLSRYAAVALDQKKKVSLSLDLFPALIQEKLEEQMIKFKEMTPYKSSLQFLHGFLPAKLCPVILREARIEENQEAGQMSDEEIHSLAKAVKQFSLRISGTLGFDKAQTTRGGVDVSEVTEDMESKICPGLFFAGEILDVDGTCGGYNLQWAFTSGTLAAKGIIKSADHRKEEGHASN